MEMSTWVIVSWVSVAVITGVNIFVFLKLMGIVKPMLKMMFPNAKNMSEALIQAQNMMGSMGKMGMPGAPKGGNLDAQLKQAMKVLQKR